MAGSLKLLVLGGTTEASALARRLAGDPRFDPVLSFAGRTSAPVAPPIPFRVGGFGGPEGLARFLIAEQIAALVDATHPFAARMSDHARQAAAATGVDLLAVLRPPWQPSPADQWNEVPNMAQAAAALGIVPRRVFLTVGQQELAAFAATPHRYLIRSIEAARLPGATVIAARGPFQLDDELALLRTHRIETLVTKNSGGTATQAKLQAARICRIQVVMVARPAAPPSATLPDAQSAFAWLERRHASRRGA